MIALIYSTKIMHWFVMNGLFIVIPCWNLWEIVSCYHISSIYSSKKMKLWFLFESVTDVLCNAAGLCATASLLSTQLAILLKKLRLLLLWGSKFIFAIISFLSLIIALLMNSVCSMSILPFGPSPPLTLWGTKCVSSSSGYHFLNIR